MDTQARARFLAALFAVIYVTAIAAYERPIYAQCDNADSAIVSEIYGKIKADKGLAGQIRHINVTSVYNVVKLYGWADTRRDKTKVVDIATKAACVKMVNPNNFADAPPSGNTLQRLSGCGAGMKVCGDICIPESEACNIDAFLGQNIFQLRGQDDLAIFLQEPVKAILGTCVLDDQIQVN